MNNQGHIRYEKAWQNFLAAYGKTASEKKGLRDQAMARLFYQSGWTQEELAAYHGGSRSYFARRLLFGRFLGFVPIGTTVQNLPRNLSEGRFRGY